MVKKWKLGPSGPKARLDELRDELPKAEEELASATAEHDKAVLEGRKPLDIGPFRDRIDSIRRLIPRLELELAKGAERERRKHAQDATHRMAKCHEERLEVAREFDRAVAELERIWGEYTRSNQEIMEHGKLAGMDVARQVGRTTPNRYKAMDAMLGVFHRQAPTVLQGLSPKPMSPTLRKHAKTLTEHEESVGLQIKAVLDELHLTSDRPKVRARAGE